MNIIKHLDFFNPTELRKEEINIIGCGAIGSNVALQLAKLGIEKLTLWDFDKVESHNITNQVYDTEDIGKNKIDALEKHLLKQNPDIKVTKRGKWTNQPLKGILILAVDSIELRHRIAVENEYNIMIKLIIDGRIGLETAQVYCFDWQKQTDIIEYEDLTDFKDNEVKQPVSPCGTTLSVSPSVLICASCIVSSLINFTKNKKNPKIININAFDYKLTLLM